MKNYYFSGLLSINIINISLIFDDESRLVINMTTRCFCYKTYCNVPGPTLIVNANTKFDIILSNYEIGARHNMSLMNEYKDLDVTNIHTHGLHIDPYRWKK